MPKLINQLSLVRVSGHTFISNPLNESSVVLDLGANRGAFSREIRHRWGCKHVVAVEPTPDLADELAKIGGIDVERCVVNEFGEQIQFRIDKHNSESSSIVKGVVDGDVIVVEGTTLSDLMARFDDVDLVKVDVEGAEIGIFKSTPLRALVRVKQFTVEFHDFKQGSGVTRGHVLEVMERMKAIGFKAFVNSFWTYGDVLFVNQKYISIGPKDVVSFVVRGRWWPGIKRMADRIRVRV